MMNKSELKQVVLGIINGDGYLDVNRNSGKARLDIYHSSTQLEYLQWKGRLLSEIVNVTISEKRDKRKLQSGKVRSGYRLQSTFSPYLYKMSVMPYKAVAKHLVSPLAMAILWQDDGTVCWDKEGGYSTAYLCTDAWDRDLLQLFRKAFNTQYGWTPVLMEYKCRDKVYPRLRFRKEDYLKLTEIIRPHIVESLSYKISHVKSQGWKS